MCLDARDGGTQVNHTTVVGTLRALGRAVGITSNITDSSVFKGFAKIWDVAMQVKAYLP